MTRAFRPAGPAHARGTAAAKGSAGAVARPGAPGTPPSVPRTTAGGAGRYTKERRMMSILFLGPALVILAVLVAWPIVNTVWLSLHDAGGKHWVGLHNYVEMFTSPETRRAITNNLIWVVVAPTVVTVLGLVFAVLTERIRLATAFKTILFMPMAVSFLSAGVTWRLVYDESPDRGVLNAIVVSVHDAFSPSSPYPDAHPRDDSVLTGPAGGAYRSVQASATGTPALLPLVGLAADKIPAGARPAGAPPAGAAGLSGLAWLDFTPGGGGKPGVVDPTEKGLPGMKVQAVRDGRVVATATSDSTGQFRFPGLSGDGYTIQLPKSNFEPPFAGVSWLGPSLVTPAIIVSYLWIWAGFAMVLVSAGLAALPREALEAARVDGATEWQVLRRVTIPLVRPVLVVIMVTLIINVLKIFDLVYVIAPDSSQNAATVVALEMYKVSFGGGLNDGLGSALGVLLFILVVPAMIFNIRRLRRDQP
jgi:alpha-glucoside transport system permease protein